MCLVGLTLFNNIFVFFEGLLISDARKHLCSAGGLNVDARNA